MLLAQDGDQRAYRTLLCEIAPYVRAVARRYLGDRNDLEDAVQEILLVVHNIRHTYERGRPFKPWLATIAQRRAIDLLRRQMHRGRHETAGEALDARWAEVATDEDSPDRVAGRAAEARDLHAAVAALPPRQREAVELLRLRELTPREAAAASRQAPGTLKVACHRALNTLRHRLRREDHDE